MSSLITILVMIISKALDSDSDEVLGQYTDYPYPEFNETHEMVERLHYADPDRKGPHEVVPDLTLENLNHYLYRGAEDFQNNFRILVAGGGIGGTTMFLAEQLAHTNAEIIYLDFSPASMKIAQTRASIRYNFLFLRQFSLCD